MVEICYVDFQKASDSANHRLIEQNNWATQSLRSRYFTARVSVRLSAIGLLYNGVYLNTNAIYDLCQQRNRRV